ncbi:MAG TPA: hypothetical protein VGY55_04585 [Pirellulales bacterium]|jgi:hypothetical protein|nr:hypothetical protein [Pirellulales bacterium]
MIALPRRRFQFSLRTLLIVATLLAMLCGYIGRQVEIVKKRDVMAAAPGVDSVTGDSLKRIPLFRRWLGDKYYLGLSIDKSASDDEIARYKSAFPEATIMRRPASGIQELWRRVTQRPVPSAPPSP